MNLAIFLKLLASLAIVTDTDPHGISVSASALQLKQSLEILAKNPDNAQQLDQILAQVVCNDWQTFSSVGEFVAACLTNGKADKIPQAVGTFGQFASKVATN